MKNYIIYQHKNITNGKKYIGMTNNPERRWRNNGIEYKSYSNDNLPFWNSIKKHGWDNFETSVLMSELSFEDACKHEKYLIKKYNTQNNQFGYNVAEGGNGGRIYKHHPRGMLGKSHTTKTKDAISDYFTKNNHMYSGFWSEDGRSHPRGMLGKEHTYESKLQISQTCKERGINTKPVKMVWPDGDEDCFKSQNECAEYMGTVSSSSMFIRLIKTGEPLEIKYKNQYTKKLMPFLGVRLIDTSKDNTEVG